MKNLFIALLLLLAAPSAFAQTFYQGTGDVGTPVVPDQDNFALLVADVLVPQSVTTYSRPVDLYRVGVDTVAGGSRYAVGNVMVSCYDQRDSAATTDVVNMSIQPQKSQYAGDNVN